MLRAILCRGRCQQGNGESVCVCVLGAEVLLMMHDGRVGLFF